MTQVSKIPIQDQRRYKRLDHIFPVDFQVIAPGDRVVCDWQQGFSQDVSDGGLCLIVNHFKEADEKFLGDSQVRFRLQIHLPVGVEGIAACARIAWFKKNKAELSSQYMIGVEYETIDLKDRRRILRYVRGRRFFKALAIIFSFALSAGLMWMGFYNAKLRLDNEKLLGDLSVNFDHRRLLEEGQSQLVSQMSDMKSLLEQSEEKTRALQRQLIITQANDQKAIESLKRSLDLAESYQGELKQNLVNLALQKAKIDDAVELKKEEVSSLEKKVRDKLYQWLLVHRNNRTGLVGSFEGDDDIHDWGFTYDQALVAMNFINSGDLENAKKIFDFYLQAKRIDDGGLANAYYASSGEPAEFVAHVGPNVWLGLAVMQYTMKTQDEQYLGLAKEISLWLDTVKDADGGLRGGKNFSWYSTEHNLDAYAFYQMLAAQTKDSYYAQRARSLLAWLSKNAYSNISSPLVKRGKGDSTIATDTYAWSVSAIGPKMLKEIGMDPDAIMDFALNNCCVEISYAKPDGTTVEVKGFDFAKSRNSARGGVISCEWTGQMSLALKMMADYHSQNGDFKKAQRYQRMAEEYISELEKMIIASPSPVGQGDFCLPYASHEFVDTGHGWRTPKGNRTGSVAATAYAIFAMDGFNPLGFNE